MHVFRRNHLRTIADRNTPVPANGPKNTGRRRWQILQFFSFLPARLFGMTNQFTTWRWPKEVGTRQAMKSRDELTLAAIVGGLLLIFLLTRFTQPERVKPGSPEYDAYIDHYIAECLRNPPPADKSVSSHASPSESEREAACRIYVLQADRLNPDVRPLKHP
jgi:hypothetical protein